MSCYHVPSPRYDVSNSSMTIYASQWEDSVNPLGVRDSSVLALPYTSPLQTSRLRPASLNALLRILQDVAVGMEYAHSCGVMHLDLKLENVFLKKQRGTGGGYTGVVGDFGLSDGK